MRRVHLVPARAIGLVLAIAAASMACDDAEPEGGPVSSCNKVEEYGTCTEYRGYPIEEARMTCGDHFAEAPCPAGDLVGSCEKTLGSVDGASRVQVDFYYNPIRPPHTPDTLRNLCSGTSWRWTSGG